MDTWLRRFFVGAALEAIARHACRYYHVPCPCCHCIEAKCFLCFAERDPYQ